MSPMSLGSMNLCRAPYRSFLQLPSNQNAHASAAPRLRATLRQSGALPTQYFRGDSFSSRSLQECGSISTRLEMLRFLIWAYRSFVRVWRVPSSILLGPLLGYAFSPLSNGKLARLVMGTLSSPNNYPILASTGSPMTLPRFFLT